MKRVAVLIPTMGRPHRVAPVLASLLASSDQVQPYYLACANDPETVAAIRAFDVPLFLCEGPSWPHKINQGYLRTREPWIFTGADDLHFAPGWIEKAAPYFAWFEGIVGTNDLCNPDTATGENSTHMFISRAYADQHGTIDGPGAITHEGYRHHRVDGEMVATAKARGRYIHLPDCTIEHLHYNIGKSPFDATYAAGLRGIDADTSLYRERLKRVALLSPLPPCPRAVP